MATLSASTATHHEYKGYQEQEKSFEGSYSGHEQSGEAADDQLSQVMSVTSSRGDAEADKIGKRSGMSKRYLQWMMRLQMYMLPREL
jgi:hypothetical protein